MVSKRNVRSVQCAQAPVHKSVVRAASMTVENLEQRTMLSLVGQWNFNETGGVVAADSSGYNNNATLNGGAIFDPSSRAGFGNVLALDGTGYARVADADVLDDTSQFTMAMWAFPTNLDGQARALVSKRVSSSSNISYSAFFYTGNKLYIDIDGSGDRFASNTTFANNTLYHIAIVYDGTQPQASRVKLYVNGVLDKTAGETSSAIPNYASDLHFGIMNAGYATKLAGRFDDFKLDNEALTPSQILDAASLPQIPTGLSATAVSARQVDLAWTDNATNEANYEVERRLTGGSWAKIATLGADATSYSDTKAMGASNYEYRVRATNSAGPSPYSNTVSATTPLAAPASVRAVPSTGSDALIRWVDHNGGETGYRVRCATDAGFTQNVRTFDLGPNTTSFLDTGGDPGATLYYEVSSVGSGGSTVSTAASGAITLGRQSLRMQYRVSLTSGSSVANFQDGNRGDSGYGTVTLVNSDWIDASSPEDAVRQALSLYYKNTSRPQNEFYGTAAAGWDGAFQLSEAFTVASGEQRRVIAVEDRYKDSDCDFDYNDAYAEVKVEMRREPESCCCCGSSVDADGESSTDLGGEFSSAFPMSGVGLATSTQGPFSDARYGSSVAQSQFPSLIRDGDGRSVAMVGGAKGSQRYFDMVGSTYSPAFGRTDVLAKGTSEFTLADPSGSVTKFYDFSTSVAANLRGQFKSITDAAGNTTKVQSRNADGTPSELRMTDASGTDVESWLYTNFTSGANAGKLASIVQRRKDASGNWQTSRTVEYAYYDGIQSGGPRGTIRTLTIKDAAGNVIDQSYFRWFVGGEANGYAGGLKMKLGPAALARLKATYPAYESATDAQVAPYADEQFQYDAQRRVKQRIEGGSGCSSCGGQGTTTYEYTTSGNPDGFNSWKYKSVQTLADGNQTITYANVYGQTMLAVSKETATGRQWLTFNQYDAQGRTVLQAQPSAITGFDDTKADLLNSLSENYQYLSDSSGLIRKTLYATNTTATATTSGDATGYYKSSSIQQGELGTPILQSSSDYLARTTGSTTIYVTAHDTQYRNEDGTGAQTTSYSYEWLGSTAQIQSRTITLPIVGTEQNGPGTAVSSQTVYDAFNRPVWSKNEDGFITYRAYDAKTGALVKQIVDVNTSRTSDFAGLPSGWTTPAEGGLHLITSHQVDALGRTTRVQDPKGSLTYIVYNDANHEVRTYRGFVGGSTTGPIEITREDRLGGYTETLTLAATPHLTGGAPDGTEQITADQIRSLSRSCYSVGGQLDHTDSYFSLSGLTYSTSADFGTEGAHFLRTRYSYEKRGRQARVQGPDGTISEVFCDSQSRSIMTWAGTDDTPSSDLNSDGTIDWRDFRYAVLNSGAAPAGTVMFKTGESIYDSGAVGDSNLTQSRAFYGDTQFYTTDYQYDWRNRVVGQRGADGVASLSTLDNLGEAILSQNYADLDGDFVLDSGELRGQSQSLYDDQDRLYRTYIYEVDPVTGTAGDRLTSNVWYNARGLTIKTENSNGLFSKQRYDGAGRQTSSYLSFDEDETAYADADDVTGDTVIEQATTLYDANSNTIASLSFLRFENDTTTTGELTAANSYATGSATWFDIANRPIASANYGRETGSGTRYIFATNGSLIDTNANGIPDEAEGSARQPNTSDDYIAAKYQYNDAGRLFATTDNKGHTAQSEFDLLGRKTKTIENYVDGTASETDTDTDRTTQFVCDSSGRLSQMIALNPKGSGHGVEQQVTRYLYESPFSGALVTSTIYPDSSDTDSTGSDQVKTTYDGLGRVLTLTDQRGVTHTYTYDAAGRLSLDAVTACPASVDGTILAIGRQYDDVGRLTTLTSYAGTDTSSEVVNQIQWTYDGWGNVIQSQQAHNGAVDASTPAVQYTYEDGAVDGEARFVRLAKVTYPGGREVFYNYPAGGVGAMLSRVDNIAADASGTTHYARYSYLGGGTIVTTEHPAISGGLTLTYGSGGTYSGWDRFGRIIQQLWKDGALSGGSYDGYVYTYDRNSNVLSKANWSTGNPGTLDETYGYDGLDRLIDANRNSTDLKAWNLDSLGNWSSFTDRGTTQDRTANAANEITGISGASVTPVYDAAGNMTSGPKAGDESVRLHFVYDAWNRLVQVNADEDGEPGAVVASYKYDGQNRRIQKTLGSETQDTFFNENWQALEVQTSTSGTLSSVDQYVWDLSYIDTPVVRFHDGNADGDVEDTIGTSPADNTLYYMTDANHNVTGLFSADLGIVVERYVYDPYGGKVQVLDRIWTVLNGSAYGNPMQYAGYTLDSETGMYLARTRYLNGSTGGWIQRDFAGYINGSHVYQYAVGNPTVYTDPYGFAIEIYSDPTQELTPDFARQVRQAFQDIVGKCAKIDLKPVYVDDSRDVTFWESLATDAKKIYRIHLDHWELSYANEDKSGECTCNECWQDLKKAIDWNKLIKIQARAHVEGGGGETLDLMGAVYTVNIQPDPSEHQYAEIEPGGGTVWAPANFPALLWHEAIGHGYKGIEGHPRTPDNCEDGRGYDRVIREENKARECLRKNGFDVRDRVHQYYVRPKQATQPATKRS